MPPLTPATVARVRDLLNEAAKAFEGEGSADMAATFRRYAEDPLAAINAEPVLAAEVAEGLAEYDDAAARAARAEVERVFNV